MTDFVHKHEQWISQMQEQGWSCGDTYCAATKKHPAMKPWEQLSTGQRATFALNGEHATAEPVHQPEPEDLDDSADDNDPDGEE